MSYLLDELRSDSAVGELFETNSVVDSYKTGIAVLDYMLGYIVDVHDDDGNVIDSYPALGINGGCNFVDIGKSSTAKTSVLLFLAASIVRPFDNGMLIHVDLEQAMNLTRARTMTRFTIKEMKGKYVLRQEKCTLDDLKKMIMKIYKLKTSNPRQFQYDSGRKDEFGNPIIMYQPTVFIIDSAPSLTIKLNENVSKEWEKLEEIMTQTERMRLTGEVGRFYTDILPYQRAANIIIFTINHIKVNPQMGIVKSASELLYLKQDEALPMGKTFQYIAHYMIKHVAIGAMKFTMEDDGFDGFGIRLEIIKARSNQAGKTLDIIYDKVRGVRPIRSNIHFAKENGLTAGNRNATYFIEAKDKKFNMRTVEEFFSENKEMYKVMYDHIIPALQTKLSHVRPEEMNIDEELMAY